MKEQRISILDQNFAQLIADSRESERKRSHLLLHSSAEDKIQSLLFGLQPGTVIRPHRHANQTETICCFQGEIALFFYDNSGRILDVTLLNDKNKISMFNPWQWHSYLCIQEDTIGWEIKEGPYSPQMVEFAPWCSEEKEAYRLFEQNLYRYLERRGSNDQ